MFQIGPRTDLSLGPYSTYKNISEADPRMKAFKYAMQEAFYLLTDSFPDITLTDQLKSRIANKIQQIIDLEVAFSQLITDQDKYYNLAFLEIQIFFCFKSLQTNVIRSADRCENIAYSNRLKLTGNGSFV